MKPPLLLILLVSAMLLSSCKKEESFTDNKKREGCTDKNASNFNPEAEADDGSCIYRGCTDPEALNYNPNATEEDGTCKYTNLTFYAANQNIYQEEVEDINVYVEGDYLGRISTFYRDGLDSCNAAGTISYAFKNSQKVNWKTVTILQYDVCSYRYKYDSGTVAPGEQACIKFDVSPKKL